MTRRPNGPPGPLFSQIRNASLNSQQTATTSSAHWSGDRSARATSQTFSLVRTFPIDRIDGVLLPPKETSDPAPYFSPAGILPSAPHQRMMSPFGFSTRVDF